MNQKLDELMKNNYGYYSKVGVAAILVTDKGEFKGVNIENSAYPSGICAERSAIFSAISQMGPNIAMKEIHVKSTVGNFLPPCAGCLQVMSEFFTSETTIILYNLDGQTKRFTFKELLPMAITKKDFGWK